MNNKNTFLLLDDKTSDVLAIIHIDEEVHYREFKSVIDGVKNELPNSWVVDDLIEALIQELDNDLIAIKDFSREYI